MLRRCGAALLIAGFMLGTGMLASYAKRSLTAQAGAPACGQLAPGVCLSSTGPLLAAPGHRPPADLPLMEAYGD